MREGELEDKMCETKIRMYQYRDESLQSLLGLDTMAELEDIVCAIKAQQRETRSLRQLQLEARRQIVGDAENMVKLLTGCRVFEMDLENMLRRVMEKRGEPETDPNFIESQLNKVLREFQRNFGGQRERAAMLLAFQTKQRNIQGSYSSADEQPRSTQRSRARTEQDMWGRSASELKNDARDGTTPTALRSGAQTPLWSASSANSPAQSRGASRVVSRASSPRHERERETLRSTTQATPYQEPRSPSSALSSVSNLFGLTETPNPGGGQGAAPGAAPGKP